MNARLLLVFFALLLFGCEKEYPQVNLQITNDDPIEYAMVLDPGSFYFEENQLQENLTKIKAALAMMNHMNNTHLVEENAGFLLHVRKVSRTETVRTEYDMDLSTLHSSLDLNLVRAGSSGGNGFTISYGDQKNTESFAEEDGSIYHERVDISRADFHAEHARIVRETVQDRLRRRY
jgi:hypothetical protein